MTRHRIVVVLPDDVLPLDYAIPVHVFGREASEAYDLVTVSVGGGAVPVAGGTTVVPDGGLELLRGADTIVVPGYADAVDRELPGSLVRALAGAHRRGVRMVSICSGAFALARAGVLDGLTVTTHWSLCAELAQRFPAVTVDQSVLVAGTASVLTSGGVTAGVDLCLHLLNVDLGPAAARHVSRRIVMAPRPAGSQQQFVEKAVVPPGDDVIARAQQWMLVSLDNTLSVTWPLGSPCRSGPSTGASARRSAFRRWPGCVSSASPEPKNSWRLRNSPWRTSRAGPVSARRRTCGCSSGARRTFRRANTGKRSGSISPDRVAENVR